MLRKNFSLGKQNNCAYSFPMKIPSGRPLRKKRGPLPRLGPLVQSHVYLPESLLVWAKQQPERLSGLVRRLLEEERSRQQQPEMRND